ncbi:hypothetical protein CMI47_21325 [Candidatus Pacearchaeota archaeon]|nr:hypothetical protein [Candidatus Pacearchaeota archaeon]
MAFLDNSGDIILDAILTETGRRRMAQGTFKITKFAVGDDEIDYALYDKNNGGGPAYYDLEILQTPIGEAGLQLNYGLLTSLAPDILYMPVTRINELKLGLNSVRSSGGMFYVVDTSGDLSGPGDTTIEQGLSTAAIEYMKGTATPNANYVFLETGLDVAFGQVPLGTQPNQQSYLIANQLVDNTFYCFSDSRFFGGMQGGGGASVFANNGKNHSLKASIRLVNTQRTTITMGLDNYKGARVKAIRNQIYYYGDGNDTEESYSVIGGPRSAAMVVSPVVKSGLSPQYALYGFTNQTGIVAAFNVDYIDTTIYVVGSTTGTTAQIPVRIIRRTV